MQYIKLKIATKFTLFLLLILTIGNRAIANTRPSGVSEYVLIINSYTESSDWSNNFIYPIYESLISDSSNVTIYTEHMNMLMINNKEDLQKFKNDLYSRHLNQKPKAIVLIGNTAWGVFRKDIESKWADTPVMLCAEDNYMGPEEAYINKSPIPDEQKIPLASYKGSLNLTIVYSPIYIKQTIDLMMELSPNIDSIIFLSDNRHISAQNRVDLENILKVNYPHIVLNNLISDQLSKNKLADTLKYTSKKTGILYFSWFKKSELAGNMILTTNEYKMFSRYTSLPIFTLTDNSNGLTGMLGGHYISSSAIKEATIKAFKDILSGKNKHKITTIKLGVATPHLDYMVLTEKKIPLSLCPIDTIYYSKQLTIWEEYKYQILLAIFCALAIFSFMLMRLSMLGKIKQRQDEKLILMQNYSSLFENMPIAYSKQKLEFDDDGVITNYTVIDANPHYKKYFTDNDNTLDSPKHTQNKGTYIEFISLYERAVKDNKAITVQYYHQSTGRYFSMIIVPSKVKGFMDVFYVDNTELASTQQLLRTLNHKLSMALEVANITPWKWDLEKGTIVCDVNRASGTTSEDAADAQFSVPYNLYFSKVCKRDTDRVKQAYEDLLSGKINKIKEEYRVFVKKGNRRSYEWVETQAVIDKRDEKGRPISLIGSSLVISDRKKMESDLVDAKNRAEESNRLKSAFLANMSHEIRTPLNAIVGFSEVLASAEDENEKREYVSIIENNNTLLLQLISDILDLSKIEAGTLDFNYSDLDLHTTFNELNTSFKMRMGESEVKVIYENIDNAPMIINTDKNRLSQVLINMVNNAMKFTKQGSIRFGHKFRDDNTLYFYVTDTGCGIPTENLDHVFGRFVKLNNFVQGTGLGLSICQTIIHNMGGEIGVESVEGEGSTFWFTLPFQAGAIVDRPHTETKPTTVEKNKLSVLIAEDNASNYKLFETILKSEYIIYHAWDGEEAVSLFKKHKPHIVLMDINMPKLNGYEATEMIRQISSSVPIIAVTAYAYSADEKAIMTKGFDGYTAKPIDSRMLKSQMLNLLKRQLIFM